MKNLVNAYKSQEISRGEFCRRFAAMQGYNDAVKGFANNAGVFIEYRGRRAQINGFLISWLENGRLCIARSFKEFKIKIDILKIKAAA